MTEAEWLACDDPLKMLTFLRGTAGERKLRLFICASARLLWDRFPDGAMRDAVEGGERCADGIPWEVECVHCLTRLHRLHMDYRTRTGRNWFSDHWGDAVAAWSGAILASAHMLALSKLPLNPNCERLSSVTRPQQPELLRDIFNPHQPATTDVAWATPAVTGFATSAYGEPLLPSGHLDPARLAVLSDALEEAGCSSAALLSHLGSPGPHVRGCWALDLILGRS